jgi:hypothetical protein
MLQLLSRQGFGKKILFEDANWLITPGECRSLQVLLPMLPVNRK